MTKKGVLLVFTSLRSLAPPSLPHYNTASKTGFLCSPPALKTGLPEVTTKILPLQLLSNMLCGPSKDREGGEEGEASQMMCGPTNQEVESNYILFG